MTKRIVLVILLLLLNSSLVHATNWCDDSEIVACWNIETGSGIKLEDQSSNNLDADLDTGPPSWDADVPDSDDGFLGTSTFSIDFDGSDSVDSNYDPDTNTANTFVLWSAADTIANNDRFFGSDDGDLILYSSKAGYWGQDAGWYLETADNIISGEWNHYACAYDEVADLARFYVDGVLEGSDLDIDAVNSQVMRIGASYNNGSGLYLNGRVDEFAIFSEEKDITDINSMMKGLLAQGGAAGNGVSANTIFQGGMTVNNCTIQ